MNNWMTEDKCWYCGGQLATDGDRTWCVWHNCITYKPTYPFTVKDGYYNKCYSCGLIEGSNGVHKIDCEYMNPIGGNKNDKNE